MIRLTVACCGVVTLATAFCATHPEFTLHHRWLLPVVGVAAVVTWSLLMAMMAGR